MPTVRSRTAAALAAGATCAAALLALAACADAPSAPSAPSAAAQPALARAESGGGTGTTSTTTSSATPVRPLLRDRPLAGELTKSFAVTSAHAILDWPEVGLRINVPANTVPRSGMTITVTALKGAVVAYDFGPDGSKFPYPLVLMQSTSGTNFADVVGAHGTASFEGAYFKSRAQIDGATGQASADEFLPAQVDANAAWVQFKVGHFSGWMVSTGRTR